MKRILFPMVLAAVLLGFAPMSQSDSTLAEAPTTPARVATPGVEMAQGISTITGVAISSLLGASAVGAWRYYKAKSSAERARLPWFAQPWFWVTAFVIVGLCALKDTFGMTVPVILKKPFDVLETVSHKVSGLVAAGAFVPLVASIFNSAGAAPPPGLNSAALGQHGFLAVIDMSWLYNGLWAALLVVVFAVVFLASNAINILILLSPFPVLDAGLKLFRLLVLTTVVATSLINPWFGALWALGIIGFAWFIAGWSLRLSHLGWAFMWDYGTRRWRRFTPHATENRMFLARKMERVPVRTYGQFSRGTSGNFIFRYRPWLVLPERVLKLAPGNYAVGRGLVLSEIVRLEGGRARAVMTLPPCYRSHEEELARVYGFGEVRERGLRAAWAWLKEEFGLKSKAQIMVESQARAAEC